MWFMVAFGADIYVDPATGTPGASGSAADPVDQLSTALEMYAYSKFQTQYQEGSTPDIPAGGSHNSGDTIWVREGDHDLLFLQNWHYEDGTVNVKAEAGQIPVIPSVQLQSVSGLAFEGLSVGNGTPVSGASLLFIEDHSWQGPSSNISWSGGTVSAADGSSWGASEWSAAPHGIWVHGHNVTISDVKLDHIYHAVVIEGENALVEDCVIDGFAGDGLRALADNGTFERNWVGNAYAVDANHDDGLQMWSEGPGLGTLSGIVIRDNTFVAWEDDSFAFKGNFQGIGCFDGFCDDLIIENNVVKTYSWHGITLTGSHNSVVRHNTLFNIAPNEPEDRVVRLSIVPHKDGRPSTGNVVSNNLAEEFDLVGQVDQGNLIYSESWFRSTPEDLHLLPGATAVDAVSCVGPDYDHDGVARPYNNLCDVGAYEYAVITTPTVPNTTEPPDTNTGVTTTENGGTTPVNTNTTPSGSGSTSTTAPTTTTQSPPATAGGNPDLNGGAAPSPVEQPKGGCSVVPALPSSMVWVFALLLVRRKNR